MSGEMLAAQQVSDTDAAGSDIDWAGYVDNSPGLSKGWLDKKNQKAFGTKEMYGKAHYAVYGKEHKHDPTLVGGGKMKTTADAIASLLPKKTQTPSDPMLDFNERRRIAASVIVNSPGVQRPGSGSTAPSLMGG